MGGAHEVIEGAGDRRLGDPRQPLRRLGAGEHAGEVGYRDEEGTLRWRA